MKHRKYKAIEVFLWLFIYKIIIEFMYAVAIAPTYSYSGLKIDIDITKFFLSNVYLLIIAIVFPKKPNRASVNLYLLTLLFLIVPTLSYSWLNSQDYLYTFFIVICTLIISTIIKISIKPVSLNSKSKKNYLMSLIFIGYLITTFILILQRGGFDARALDFDNVYDLRSENNLGFVQGYLMNWSVKVFFPLFAVYFYFKKKYAFLMLCVLLQSMMYFSFGNKAFLFSIGILFITIIVMNRKNYLQSIVIAMSSINLIAYLLYVFNLSDILVRAIPYRLLYIPAQIQYQYYDFFKDRDKLIFADGLIGDIFNIQSPFNQNVSMIIGMYFSHNGLGTNANTGIFADAYANGGLLLMLISAIIFASLLILIDIVTYRLPLYVVIGSFSYITFVFNDTALLTTLLTGGMGLMIFLLALFNLEIKKENNGQMQQ